MSKKIIDFIDLTTSLSSNRSIHIANDEVINLDSDESFISEVKNNDSTTKKGKAIQTITKKKKASKNSSIIEQATLYNFGECPICMDKLGENPLASTKCGHVFCMKCLERSLLIEKKCPTCRRILRRKSEYHPLYLNYNN